MSDRSIGDFSRLVRQDTEEAARRLKATLPREVLLDFIHELDRAAGPVLCGNPDPDPRMEPCHAPSGHDGPHRHSGKIVAWESPQLQSDWGDLRRIVGGE